MNEWVWWYLMTQGSLAALLHAAGLPAALLQKFEDEELSVGLLLTMSPANLRANLQELGLSHDETVRLARQLHPQQPLSAPEAPRPSKAPPEPDPLVICVDHGLCNRLRALLSYREVAQREGRRLLVVWQRDKHCNGEFLDCFEPLPGVRLIREVPSWAPAAERVNHCHPQVRGTPAEVQSCGLLKPWPALRAAIDARVRECAPFVACHVRRTDMLVWAKLDPKSRYARETADERFDAFVDAHRSHNIYLATDCAATHARFAAAHSARMRACAALAATHDPHKHRQTTLTEAVVDLYVCAAAVHFMGSAGSSFSDTIAHLRAVGGTRSAHDRHTLFNESDYRGRAGVGPPIRELCTPTEVSAGLGGAGPGPGGAGGIEVD